MMRSRGINNFSLPQLHQPYSLGELWISWVEICIFQQDRRNTKKLWHSNLFQLTIFKHGLLEGSTILLQYRSISRTKLESSRLGEFKYALLAGYDIRLKNESLRKGKKWHFTTGVRGHCSMGCLRDRHYYFDTATQAVHCWIALD